MRSADPSKNWALAGAQAASRSGCVGERSLVERRTSRERCLHGATRTRSNAWCATTDLASRLKTVNASSTPSSPPSRPGRGRVSGSQMLSGWRKSRAVSSRSRSRRAGAERASYSVCRPLSRPETPQITSQCARKCGPKAAWRPGRILLILKESADLSEKLPVAWRLLNDQAREALMVSRANSRSAGFTLIEIAIVITVIAIMAALAVPAMEEWMANARLKEAARQVADAFTLARENAIRTGDDQIVFFQTDMLGAALLGGNGLPVPILTLDDGRPGTPGQNCRIVAGKGQTPVNAQPGVNWGFTPFPGIVRAPNDTGAGAIPASGSTFVDPTGAATTWVMFGPNGIP